MRSTLSYIRTLPNSQCLGKKEQVWPKDKKLKNKTDQQHSPPTPDPYCVPRLTHAISPASVHLPEELILFLNWEKTDWSMDWKVAEKMHLSPQNLSLLHLVFLWVLSRWLTHQNYEAKVMKRSFCTLWSCLCHLNCLRHLLIGSIKNWMASNQAGENLWDF